MTPLKDKVGDRKRLKSTICTLSKVPPCVVSFLFVNNRNRRCREDVLERIIR